ncbi:hypothetical protein [Streptomyces sp. NPDC005017]|uniref:hypothetical protein n=1 Tax=Streptomyces sp. NPDC005017 TaxID=3364706 RepID=UPI0036C81C03
MPGGTTPGRGRQAGRRPGPTGVRVRCQRHAERVTSDGCTNDVRSCLPDHRAGMTNTYLLDGVPACP